MYKTFVIYLHNICDISLKYLKIYATYICAFENIFWYPVLLLGSQCQTSSLEKHSSHFESIMSLFKLPPTNRAPNSFNRINQLYYMDEGLTREIF